ncbi:MAG: VOC family protein [Pseudoalteromonas spongiae]
MVKIKGLDHIVLRTDKLSAMLTFYCQVLGCTKERELAPEWGLTQLRAGNALIDLVEINGRLGQAGGGAPSNKDNNLDHFCLQLESIKQPQLIRHLRQHGIEVGDIEQRYGAEGFGYSIYVTDPQGNTVELKSLN